MAKPTPQQVQDLELAHKLQYFDLVQANHLWIQLLKKVPIVNKQYDKNSRQWKALVAYGQTIAKLVGKWYVRQREFETKAKVPAVSNLLVKYFGSPKDEKNLYEQARLWLAPNSPPLKGVGLGIIPLIIWGVIAVVAAFTAYEITDELNTTAEEKQDLIKQTQVTLKELNVSGPQAAAIISQTQQEASATNTSGGMFGGLMPKIVIGGILFYLFTKNKNANANG